jgi:hypothetical protein
MPASRVLREKDSMREDKIRMLPLFYPLSPILSLWERALMRQQ